MTVLRTRPPDRLQRWQRALRVAVFTVCLAAVVATVVYWYTLMRTETNVEGGVPVRVEIPSGAGSAEIGKILADRGVVANASMFRIQARLEEADGKLRAGEYDLETGMPYELVLERLVAGPPPVAYVLVTIPEGFLIDQIAARLEEQAGIPRGEFLALAEGGAAGFATERPYLADAYRSSLEGYLFPKTYRLEAGTTARQAIDMMLDQFEREIAQVDVEGAEARGVSLPELVNIASMIERETKVAKERRIVSSVIYNRLERKMLLQICATIEYVLPGNHLRLTNEDLKIDSPYNTYTKPGLPPGPISNPGLAALQAAAEPAETDYIYYVLTGKDGSHTFAKNNADFLQAKRKSKEVFGE